ncbi:phage holin family protein [Dethiothermospora halolimnae]|uniref:phage holin family protein n=1 Tax=Dethiothermospora halolimnae TaxID=3114390 RepID=UPI003CCBBB90
MNRLSYLLELSFISGIVAFLESFYNHIDISYIVLLTLIIVDTLTGLAVALRYGRFSSKGLCKLLKKIITYSTAIFTVKLLEIGVITIVQTTLFSRLIVAFLEVTETVSILENLTMLGVPLPSNFITFLINNLKIPGLSKVIKVGRKNEKDISEISDIIKYQLPLFDDKDVKDLLKIRFNLWKDIALQINKVFKYNGTSGNEHLYYKIMSIIKTEAKEMEVDLKKKSIPKEYINTFHNKYEPLVSKWLSRVEKICFSNKSDEEKRKDIIDNIVITCYQTILIAHKVFSK